MKPSSITCAALFTAAACLPPSSAARAQQPSVFQQVSFEQRLDEQIPLALEFRDHRGRSVSLDQYFGDKPVVLSLVYYECPMLCTLELNGLVRSLRTLDLEPGKDFTLLTVSFDPRDATAQAAEKRRNYLQQYNRPEQDESWPFLTGEQDAIKALCEAVGFRYAFDPDRGEYAHASGIVVLTPKGKVARYFYGIDYPPKDLRLGLVEASQGKIGTAADQLLLLCYGYDPATGKYGFLIMNVIRLGGAATVLALAGFIGLMVYRDRSAHSAGATPASVGPTPGTQDNEPPVER